MRAERLCLSDVFVGRFGRLTLKRIEAVTEESRKVTISCEPSHQFYAGQHSASILTHEIHVQFVAGVLVRAGSFRILFEFARE